MDAVLAAAAYGRTAVTRSDEGAAVWRSTSGVARTGLVVSHSRLLAARTAAGPFRTARTVGSLRVGTQVTPGPFAALLDVHGDFIER